MRLFSDVIIVSTPTGMDREIGPQAASLGQVSKGQKGGTGVAGREGEREIVLCLTQRDVSPSPVGCREEGNMIYIPKGCW